MKPTLFFALFALFGALLSVTGCTYNVVQQQNGSSKGSQLAVVGGEGEHGVTAVQGNGSLQVFPPFSTYRYPSGNYNDPSRGYYDSDGRMLAPAPYYSQD
jgi:hypothetical protein